MGRRGRASPRQKHRGETPLRGQRPPGTLPRGARAHSGAVLGFAAASLGLEEGRGWGEGKKGKKGKKGEKKGKKGRETHRQGAGGGELGSAVQGKSWQRTKGGEEGKERGEGPLIAGEEAAGARRGGGGAGEKPHLKESQARGRKDRR